MDFHTERSPDSPPLIVGFVADLLFASRIQSVAEGLGYEVEWIERLERLEPLDPLQPQQRLTEPLTGEAAVLVDRLTQYHPALMIIDLSNSAVPWREWLPVLKSASATRRTPVICFGSHVDAETMQAAKSAGADAVLARSRFVSGLPDLIRKYARVPDHAAIQAACQEELSSLALEGLEAFNQGRYFEAHERLEEAWNEEQSPGRELYRAILQVAVAYLHIERGNFSGAMKMFLRVRQWIDPLPDECRGVDVERLRREAQTAHDWLAQLGPEGISDFDRSLLKPVHYRWEK